MKEQKSKHPKFMKVILYILGLVIITMIGFYGWMKTKVPSYNKDLKVNGLREEVEVHTDEFGVPHIFAKNQSDLYYALGYVQARERLFQMQLMQRLASGRVSELVGEKGLSVDRLYRTLGLKRNAEKWLKENSGKIQPDAMSAIDSYLKGVNQFIAEGDLPVESKILGMKGEPIEKSDMFAFVAFMGLSFAEAIHTDSVISSLESEFGTDKVNELTSEISQVATNVSSDSDRKFAIEISKAMKDFKEICHEMGISLFQGSNSWVIAPNRSKSGKAMLANDPHIAFSNPTIWFEAYLHSPDIDLYGHFLPSIPFAIVGFNKDFGWGLTMFENDDMDLYLEKISSNDSSKYGFKGKELSFEVIEETIKVKGGKDEKLIIRSTIHGPVLTGIAPALKDSKEIVSVKWEMFAATNNPINSFYGFNYSKNQKQFQESGEYLKVPGLNVVYADKLGNIGYYALGGIYDNNFIGDRLLDGESGKYEWGRLLPYSMQPKSINPASGIIFTANHKHFGYVPYKLNGYWQADDRSERLTKLFKEKQKYSIEDMKEIIMDDYFSSSDWIVAVLLEELKNREEFLRKDEKQALEILRDWNRKGKANEVGASIFSELRVSLLRNIFLDEMGKERYESIAGTAKSHHFLKKVYNNKNSKWWDNINTTRIETRQDILLKSYQETIAILLGRLGTDLNSWKWGRLHTLTLTHPLGMVPVLSSVFNSGPRSSDGGTETVNNLLTKFSKADHKVIAGPSMRTLIDFADVEHTLIIGPLGQSAHRLSPHWEDQAELFINGKFRTINLVDMKIKNKDRIFKMKPE
ncbi:MAG: penicillin acylase family protein [Leptospiraceae bacterium]|nr:penicillin acylase family protein [Leptospiraceae bacterium]